MVEQLTLNQLVPGSSPGGATKIPFFPSHFPFLRTMPRRRSSMVEHLFCKQAVAGSNPIAGSSRLASNHEPRRSNFPLPDGVMVAQTTLTRFV